MMPTNSFGGQEREIEAFPQARILFLKFINVDYAPSVCVCVCVCMCALSVDVLPLTPSGANFIDG